MREAPYIAVGGGLAGAAFALELARNGVAVVLLESTRAPHHKVCGEFLSTEAQALLSYLGLDLAAMGAMQVSIFRLANGRDCAEAPLPFRGAGLSRFCLDQALLEAAESQGANVERGVQVTQIDASDETVTVRTGSQVFTGRAAALATGKHNLRQYPRAASDMVGFKLQLRVTPDSLGRLEDVVQLVTFNGGYIGACIVEDRLVTLCWVLHRALLQRIGTSWPEQAKYFAQQSEILAALLHEAKPQWDKPVAVAGIPYGYLRRSPIASNVFPLGDQLAVIPSFTGDGMSIALTSGIAAAQAVLAGESAAQFQAQIVGRLRPQFRWAGLVNVLFEVRRLHGFSVKLAAALPSLVTWLAQSTRLKGFERSLDGPQKARQSRI
ncbi:MAG TPA: FAD-dependent monooxygenase [Methyloceanibacter sp.]|nr:FAD-dependent monooxygenase [Methyloceanibacter sp.]